MTNKTELTKAKKSWKKEDARMRERFVFRFWNSIFRFQNASELYQNIEKKEVVASTQNILSEEEIITLQKESAQERAQTRLTRKQSIQEIAEKEQQKQDERWEQIMAQISLQSELLAKQEAQFGELLELFKQSKQ